MKFLGPKDIWQETIGSEFSGDVEYRTHFECAAVTARRARVLDLGQVRYACRVIMKVTLRNPFFIEFRK